MKHSHSFLIYYMINAISAADIAFIMSSSHQSRLNKKTCTGLADVKSLQTLKCSPGFGGGGGGRGGLPYKKDGGAHRTLKGLNNKH